ncbi:SCO1860 family LAETG-anchored protein [Streptomyces sp. TRM64462]|uniref:SCO1860 family LAETG-anchored protein n=1 Tax=Streptomyces sp. TRM64462 TaxID=2741726 RepID=UPI001586ECA6|nr:SCO1860 family LAETG-anchored protein [Streptomyces sp. TRM64462]
MNSTTSRRRAALATAALTAGLTAGPLATATAAHATAPAAPSTAPATPVAATTTGGDGRATAAVLRAALDVSLLDKAVRVPVRAALNEVEAPATAEKTALTVRLDGVEQGRPVSILRADVATAKATADAHRAEGGVRLARARVHLPGLPLLSLIEAEEVTAKAVCVAGEAPVAASNVLGRVTVLGKRVTLTPGGRSQVDVPGVGRVTLDLSRRTTTSATAAATALELKVEVDPLNLNVADVHGTVTLAEATCTAPARPAAPAAPGQATPAEPAAPGPATPAEPAAPARNPEAPATEGLTPQSAGTATPAGEPPAGEPRPKEALAATGADSRTPYILTGAAALLVAGAAAALIARRAATRNRP